MKKLMVTLIAATFATGSALAQPAAAPTPADSAAAKEQKKAAPARTTKAAKKPVSKEEKKAAFAERQAEMQKQSGAKFPTATPRKTAPKSTAAEKEISNNTGKGTQQVK